MEGILSGARKSRNTHLVVLRPSGLKGLLQPKLFYVSMKLDNPLIFNSCFAG